MVGSGTLDILPMLALPYSALPVPLIQSTASGAARVFSGRPLDKHTLTHCGACWLMVPMHLEHEGEALI